jgi:hypothetical protein
MCLLIRNTESTFLHLLNKQVHFQTAMTSANPNSVNINQCRWKKMKSEEWTTQKTSFVQSSSMISNSKTTYTFEVCPKRQILCTAGVWSVTPKPHILLRCAQKTNFVKSSSLISNSKTNHLSEVCSDISANRNEIEVRKVDYPKKNKFCAKFECDQ